MKSLCIVFPMPARYFDDMMEACVQLHDFYKNAAAYPLFVATMKRSYYFEDSTGAYAELEGGDRFLIFQGEPACFYVDNLFHNRFPAPGLLQKALWEGADLQIGIVAIDHALKQTFEDLQIDINTYVENEWILIEDYAVFTSGSHFDQYRL